MRTTATLILLLTAAPLAAQTTKGSGGVLIPEQAAFDVQHYELRLSVDPKARQIGGSLTMTARALAPVERVVLDLDDRLKVSRVEQDGKRLEHRHADGRIAFALKTAAAQGSDFSVTVHYGGKPRRAPNPPWDGGFTWSRTPSGAPWVATSCQGEGADLWWPCKDHPSDEPESMDLYITVPKPLVCASNGVLVGVADNGKAREYHWSVLSPINNYGVALNIAPYDTLETTVKSVAGEEFPVVFYVLPEHNEQGRKLLKEIVKHIEFFEDVIGPYPFRNEKYGVAETPHLGMEHQTIIAYGNRFRQDADGYDWLHHHEASHEWWANLVTCADWKDMWIHESFATYMQALYLERTRGPEGLRAAVAAQGVQIRNVRPVAPRATHDSKQIYFAPDGSHDNDIYNKGSLVLHTLRWHLGDELFFRILRRFAYPTKELEAITDGSQTRFADTDDFTRLAEAMSGQDLRWFFEVYLRQPKLPKIRASEAPDSNDVVFEWEVPIDVDFPLDIPVEVDGKIVRVKMQDGRGVLRRSQGASYRIDPGRWLLRNRRR